MMLCVEADGAAEVEALPMPGCWLGGRHRRTPTLQSMSSSIFLFGPFGLETHRRANTQHMHTAQQKDKEVKTGNKKMHC